METITKSTQETQSFGQEFAHSLKGGEILALVGDLGAGKTSFVQGLAKGLGINQPIVSPTFILMRSYNNLYHLDLYRLEGELSMEIENLGLQDLWGKKGNIVVIEWAEKIRELLPKKTIWIDFQDLGEDKRKISIKKP